jgi:hypothetical protein
MPHVRTRDWVRIIGVPATFVEAVRKGSPLNRAG